MKIFYAHHIAFHQGVTQERGIYAFIALLPTDRLSIFGDNGFFDGIPLRYFNKNVMNVSFGYF